MVVTDSFAGFLIYWNSRPRLAEAALPSGEIFTYSYSPSGTRLTKASSNGTFTRYLYDGIRLQSEVTKVTGGTEVTKVTTTSFSYTPSGEPYSLRRSTQTFYYHLNKRDDVISVTDRQGKEVASYAYSPWGNVEKARGPLADSNPIRYAGYYYDSETGLYYLINRYYDSSLGRFISKDSVKHSDKSLLEKNEYLYCRNEPVNHADATGKWADTLHYSITFQIAKSIGFKYRETVARGARDRDSLSLNMHPDFKYHFDRIEGYKDSRKVYYFYQHRNAIILAKRHKPLKGSYELGLGLHCVQDYYAHGFTVPIEHVYPYNRCDDPSWKGDPKYKQDPKWGPGKGWPGYPNRLQVAKKITKKELLKFKKDVGKYF